MKNGIYGRFARVLGTLLVPLLLSSCYIPDNFLSELRLSKYGDWALTYKGDFIYAPILHDYAGGRINSSNEDEKLNNIYNDLVRDPAIKDIKKSGKGRFHVRYERSGHLDQVQLTALLRRDSRMLALKANKDGSIIIHGNGVKASDAQRMAELGISMQGEFRITTDANVVNHNAPEVRAFGQYRVYVWKIENALSVMPHLVMLREQPAQ